MQSRRVVVVGQGYVGLPLAMRAVEVGYDVVGLEVDQHRVEHLAAARSYIEDISSERLAAALGTGRYVPTSDYEDCAGFQVAVITVPTPLRDSQPDLGFIEQACAALAPHVTAGATVVLESTTYPGTTAELVAPLLERGSGLRAGDDFFLGYSPERIDPGNPTWTLTNTPKVVSGLTPRCLDSVAQFYSDVVDSVVPVSGLAEAELTKLLENTFRHVNIALVNELAVFAHELGIDVWEAIDAAATKPFGFMRFTPGPGVGGHCLPVDPSYLSWRVKQQLNESFRFVELANEVNDHMPAYVVRRVAQLLNREKKAVNGSRILVLGLAYKKNTSDARESPSTYVVQALHEQGAEVRVVDPHIASTVQLHAPLNAVQVELTGSELDLADAVVLLVDHDAFDMELLGDWAGKILDTRHCIPKAEQL